MSDVERDREERPRARARRIATTMTAATIILQLGHVVLGLATGSLADQGGVQDMIYVVVTILSSIVFALVGRAIVRRQPRNTIGWLMLTIPLVAATAFFVGDYATEALVNSSGSLPFGRPAAWLDRWLSLTTTLVFIPLFLLFPDGHIASRRWRFALWLAIAGPVLAIVSFALTPGRLTGGFADLTSVTVSNPLGVPALRGPLDAMTLIGGAMSFAAAIVAGISLVVRFRQSAGETRQQIKWLAFVALAFIVEFGIMVVGVFATNDNDLVGDVGFLVMFLTIALGIPIACGVAILKYRLYELDVVIRKTVGFGLLAIFITLVYVAVVGGIGALVGSTSNTALSFAAAAALAILFQPARERANRIADRLVYGKRATPYEVLAEFSGRVGETYSTDDVLPRMAQLLGEGSGAASATVWIRVGAEIRPAAAWPEPRPADALAIEGDALPAFAEHAVEVRHQGELLGALTVTMPPADPMDPTKEKLVGDLAAQAGLVLRNVRLIEELRASRQRLVSAQDEERRKLERNLHDGAQQHLVALAVQLKLLEQQVGRDPDRERELVGRLQAAAGDALDELRDLARGIYPPLLADKGLPTAIEAQARKAAVTTTVEAKGIERYPQDVEAAVYFCTLEALNNVAKYAQATHANVRLAQDNGTLIFEVRDDGAGFDPATSSFGTGLQGMADRLDAIGGSLHVESAPGIGTTVAGRVPTASGAR